MNPVAADRTVQQRFAEFAAQTRESSPSYSRLAEAMADDVRVTTLLALVEPVKRQPSLLFAVLRWHGVPVQRPDVAAAWIVDHPAEVVAGLREHRTQTNEVARCALLLSALHLVAETSTAPLALIDLGSSAGLGLRYESYRYRYRFDDGATLNLGSPTSRVVLDCSVRGPAPTTMREARMPRIARRVGVDLDPVDVTDPAARRWLECLVWPEHDRRRERLAAALDLAAADPSPPPILRADIVDGLARLLDSVPAGLTPVVTHAVSLAYLTDDARASVVQQCRDAGVARIGLEGQAVMPGVEGIPAGVELHDLVLSLDHPGHSHLSAGAPASAGGARALALAHPHGEWMTWLGATSPDP